MKLWRVLRRSTNGGLYEVGQVVASSPEGAWERAIAKARTRSGDRIIVVSEDDFHEFAYTGSAEVAGSRGVQS